MSRRLGSSLHTIDPLRHFFLFPGAMKCWGGAMFSKAPRRDSQDLYCFSFVWIFSMVKTIVRCLCHLVRVTFTFPDGKVSKIARWWPQGLSRCYATLLGSLQKGGWLALFIFCLVVLPTRCLLDVSRLLGLTLRPSAPVYYCHRDSLTRWRLAFTQEAVRGSPRLVLYMTMCLHRPRPFILGTLRRAREVLRLVA